METEFITIMSDPEMRALVKSFFDDSEWAEYENDLDIQKWILRTILEQ